jgi:NAD(P)-dependent dehydrogenase (short-subunit alcohol dehydrogenase family)
MSWSSKDIPDLHGKVAVVTGANGGLGLASAKALAGGGAHVVMAVRNKAKAADAYAVILAEHPDASLEIVDLDLGSLASVAAAAKTIAAAHDRIDILMCNAGVMALPQGTTAPSSEHARHLGISTRTLQRRLGEEGVTFQETLADVREELARHYLTQSALSLTEIAFLLGYDDPNSFRALNRRTGRTPLRVRGTATG